MRDAQAARAVASVLHGGGASWGGLRPAGLRIFLDPGRYSILRTEIQVRRSQPWLGLSRDMGKDSALALPSSPASLDAVVAVDIVEHSPRTVRAAAFAEFQRVPRGPIILHCPAQPAD